MSINYDYSCDECSVTIEVCHSIKETPTIPCPKCEAGMRREFGVSNYIMVKSGKTFLGDTWDKRGINPNDPEYMKRAEQKRRDEKRVGLTNDEVKAADAKSMRDKGHRWIPGTPADI